MGFKLSSFQSNLPYLASICGRFECNKIESQGSNVCVSFARQSGLESRCIEHLFLEGLDRYGFCPVALIPQGILKMVTYRCRIIILPGGQGCFGFGLGSGGYFHKSPSKTTLVGESVESVIQQQASQQPYISEYDWYNESVMNIREDSQRQYQSKLRSLRGAPQGESINPCGPFCEVV